jgi:hypothetical protein
VTHSGTHLVGIDMGAVEGTRVLEAKGYFCVLCRKTWGLEEQEPKVCKEERR